MALSKNGRKPLQLAVLISNKGTGTNLQAVIDAINEGKLNARITIVFSDKEDAKGLKRAKNHQISSLVKSLTDRRSERVRDIYSQELAEILNRNGVRVAILAGFATILSQSYLETFGGITINIHPGLVPDKEDGVFLFPDETEAPWNQGLMTEKAVANFLRLRLKYAGSTIHIVTSKTDFGPVLERAIVEVRSDDTVSSLYARLKLEEHKELIKALQKLSAESR